MGTRAQNSSPAEPPAPFRQTSPQVVELRQGGGWLAIVVAGVAIALGIAGILHIAVEPAGQGIPPGLFGISVALLAFGVVMAFGRTWLTLDLSRGCVFRSYGLLGRVHTRERLLSEFNAVVIVHEAGDADSGECYPVRLRSIAEKDFAVTNPIEFGQSRSQAEYLSVFLQLPLVDTTTDHDTIVAPERAGQSLHERLPSGADEAPPMRPAKMRCQVTESLGKTVVVVPGGGSWPVAVLSVVFPLVMLLVVIPAFLRFFTRGASPLAQFAFMFAMVVIFVVPTLFVSVNLMVGSKRKRATVTASACGLEIAKRSGWRTRTTQIASADLLDLDCSTADAALKSARRSSRNLAPVPTPGAAQLAEYAKRWFPARGIIVKTRHELISFGEGLPAAELQYLSWLLRRTLAGQ